MHRFKLKKNAPDTTPKKAFSMPVSGIGAAEDTVSYILGSDFAEIIFCNTPFLRSRPASEKDWFLELERAAKLETEWDIKNKELTSEILRGGKDTGKIAKAANRINARLGDVKGKKTNETTYTPEELRLRAAKRAKKTIRRLLNSNPDMTYMETFTFAITQGTAARLLSIEEQKDRKVMQQTWKMFCRDLKRKMKREGLEGWKWLRILELHDSKKTDERKRGTYHLHVASNIPLEDADGPKLWGYGRCETTDFRSARKDGKPLAENPGAYMSKYIEKDVLREDREPGERAYTCSRNLERPVVVFGREAAAELLSKYKEVFACDFRYETEGAVFRGKKYFLSKPKKSEKKENKTYEI